MTAAAATASPVSILQRVAALLLLLAPAAQALQADVTEEQWIRAAARALVVEPSAQPAVPVGQDGWRGQVALLEAYARAGAFAPLSLARLDTGDRVEVAAAKLRVLPWTEPLADEFEERLTRGLRSPFGAERSAALHRASLWSLESNAMDGRASRLFARELVAGGIADDVVEPLFRMALRSGDDRRLASLLELPIAAEELERADRGGWDPLLGFFEDIVALPLSLDELTELQAVSTDPGPLACVQLVARVRDGLDIDPPAIADLVALVASSGSAAGGSELDAVVEAFVDALSGGGGAVLRGPDGGLVHGEVRELGEALLVEAARRELEFDSRERCLRTAARLLPVAELLPRGLSLAEEQALGLWDVLDRRDDWSLGDGFAAELGQWLGHASVGVREAAVRAVGRRYAYAGRSDLERVLVRALDDDDPTLRSLAFAWLAKSERPRAESAGGAELDETLFAAWRKEGHGTESPTLTERQGRWLAQLPRDRQAVPYRGALLDLLSLEGSSQEAVGAGSLELLGGFVGDDEIFLRVSILLERSLVGIEAKSGYLARLPYDSSAARAVRILHRVDAGKAEPLIAGALLRSMDPMHGPDARGDARPQLPKTSVALLARTEVGRTKLMALQDQALPRRVGVEVALQLLQRGIPATGSEGAVAERCAARLMGDFDRVDGALRVRAIKALGSPLLRGRKGINAFLMGLTGVGSDEAERSVAIEALGRRRALHELASVLNAAVDGVGPDAGTIDAGANAARALGLAGGAGPGSLRAARVALRTLRGSSLVNFEERQLETVRGALMESLCALHAEHGSDAKGGATSWLSEEEVQGLMDSILQAPLERARLEGPQQFQPGRRIESQFLWASELAALKTLGKTPGKTPALLRRAVGDSDRWGHLDGRTLLALARVAQEAGVGDLALELASASVVALAGEGAAPDLRRRLAEARWLLGSLCAAAGMGEVSARVHRSLLGSYRRGALPRSVLRAMLPSLQRPLVVTHQRYWASMATSSQGTGAARRIEAWLPLL